MDPIELAHRAANNLFRAGQFLAAAIVYGECVKRKFEDPVLLVGFGSSVAKSAGVLVDQPFYKWAARIFESCLVIDPASEHADIAREWLVELAKTRGYEKQPPLELPDIEPLLDFLDIEPANLFADAVERQPANDRMFAIIGLGGLGSPRFASAIARAVSGAWGESAGCAALKRIHPYAGHRMVRDALVTARARPTAEEEYGPYLRSAEAMVASIPITIETPPGYRKVRPPGTPQDFVPEPTSKKPWWKFWSAG